MSDLVDKLFKTMAKQLDQRAQVPASDIWPGERADITKTFDYTGPYLIRALNEMFSQGLEISEIAPCFERPARIAYLCYLYSSQTDSHTPDDRKIRIDVAENLMACVNYLRDDDPFLLVHQGINRIYRSDENGIIPELENQDFTDPKVNGLERKVRLVFAGLAILIEHIYFAWMGAAKECHGIYDYHGKRYLVRDYDHLKVPHWRFSQNLPWESLRFITEEGESAYYAFDFNGRIMKSNSCMKRIAMLADGKPVRADQIDTVIAQILDVLNRAHSEAMAETSKMSSEDLLIQFALSQFFTVKAASDKVFEIVSQKKGKRIESKYSLDELPEYIRQNILQSENVPSSFEPTRRKLIRIPMGPEGSEKRIDLLYSFFHPGKDAQR